MPCPECACATGRAIDGFVAIEHSVAAMRAFAFRRIGPEHVADAANGRIERMHRLELLAHQFADDFSFGEVAPVLRRHLGAHRF